MYRNNVDDPGRSSSVRCRPSDSSFIDDPYYNNLDDLLRSIWDVTEYDIGHDGCRRNGESLPDDPIPNALKVEAVDYHIDENTKAHKTDEFDIVQEGDRQLVVRRGQAFDIDIAFSRPYIQSSDDLRLVFELGWDPEPSKDTHVEFVLSNKDISNKWGAKILSTDNLKVKVRIFTPPNLFIGRWKFKVHIIKKGDKDNKAAIHQFTNDKLIYILFNPWNKDDQVHMSDSKLLEEYVLNQTGKLYIGNYKQITSRVWNFGQFESVVLDCILDLLDDSLLPMSARGNPITICRRISALANSPDDGGIVVGKWSNYDGGVSPMSWQGSVAIIEQYHQSKMSVKYGQCWVFSGVVTSLCRAIGIPVRSVTNFESAHDTDGSITIDYHFDAEGKRTYKRKNDSIWNFHVWNDVWMSRPDLPAGCGGWQAIDSTPQEPSGGIWCGGPMPLNAIKIGDVNLPYDGQFVFAEVNADKVTWIKNYDRTWTKVLQKGVVGKKMSTKKVAWTMDPTISVSRWWDDPDREDVTLAYKFKEGSADERAAVIRANQMASNRKHVYETGPKDMKFELLDRDEITLGQDFDVTIHTSNESKEVRDFAIMLTATAIFYTGVPHTVIKTEKFVNSLEAGKSFDAVMKISVDDYLHKLVDHCQMTFTCFVRVKQTNQVHVDQANFRLRKPHLTIKAPTEGKVGETFDVDVSFVNPLPVLLTSCSLSVEGPGLQSPLILLQPNVAANQTFTTTFKLTPRKFGIRSLCVNFNSKQVEGVTGHCSLKVRP